MQEIVAVAPGARSNMYVVVAGAGTALGKVYTSGATDDDATTVLFTEIDRFVAPEPEMVT